MVYTISKAKVIAFNKTWPGSIIPEKSCWFEIDKSGNLVDMSNHLQDVEGYELVALSQDATFIGRPRKEKKC